MDTQRGRVLLRVNFYLDRPCFVWYHVYSEKTNEVNMSYQFTVYPNPEFDFDLLPRFSEDHGVSYSIKNIMEDDDLNEVYVGEKIIFSGNGSTDDSQVTKYQFNFGDGRETDWRETSWVEYYFEDSGQFEVILNVEDDEGARSSAGDSIIVEVKEEPVNNPPVAQIFSPKSGNEFRNDELIQFSAQGSSDSDGDSINFIWYSSLDGEILRTSAIMGEAILSQGTHIITLRVTDSQGEYTEQSIQISVSLSAESFDSDDSTLSSLSFLVTTLLVVTILQIKRKY